MGMEQELFDFNINNRRLAQGCPSQKISVKSDYNFLTLNLYSSGQ